MSQHVCSLCSEECPRDGELCEHCKEADTFVNQVPGNEQCPLCCRYGPIFWSQVFPTRLTWCYECAVAITRFASAQRFLLAKKEAS